MKKTIALLTGGTTGERVVSIQSASMVVQNIDIDRFNVYEIILTGKKWSYKSTNGVEFEIDKNDFSLTLEGGKILFDGVFIMIHGAPGEDGKLQGYFDLLGIPFTTSDVLTSAIAMNKGYTKAVVKGIDNLNVANSIQLFKDKFSTTEISAKLKLPYFVKPNNGGSSIGMSKVKTMHELEEALQKAFNEDTQVLIEEFVNGREFSVGVFRTKGKTIVLPTTEVKTANEFFDFDAKYTAGVTEEITPGNMTEEEKLRVEQVVSDVYDRLNCRGIVRVDYFLEHGSGDFYFIEINTIPGQTATSFIPQQVAAMGLELKDFYTQLLEETLF